MKYHTVSETEAVVLQENGERHYTGSFLIKKGKKYLYRPGQALRVPGC
jgi:hypothetical protein